MAETRREEGSKLGSASMLKTASSWEALVKNWILDRWYTRLDKAEARCVVLEGLKIPATVVFLACQPIPTYAVVSPRR
jgi:hypothetical protein